MLQRPGSSWGFGALLKDTSVVVLKEDTTPPPPAGVVPKSAPLPDYATPDLRFEPTTFRLQDNYKTT